MVGGLRVIGGRFKGRNLLPPPGESLTRPITGSVKKSLFGMLGEDLTAQVVVDLFCGTGTLGIESLSRGATCCYFAERDIAVIERLNRNLRDVGVLNQSTVWQGDVQVSLASWLEKVTMPVDLAFVDPPYILAREWDWLEAVEAIFAPLASKLAEDGIVVLRNEADVQVPAELGPLRIARQKRYGNMLVTLLVKQSTPSGG